MNPKTTIRTLTAAAALLGGAQAQAVEVRLDDDVLGRIVRLAGAQVDGPATFHNLSVRSRTNRMEMRGTASVSYRPRPIAMIWDACVAPQGIPVIAPPDLGVPGIDPINPGDFDPIDVNDPFGVDPANGPALELPALFDAQSYNGQNWMSSEEQLLSSMRAARGPQLDDIVSLIDPVDLGEINVLGDLIGEVVLNSPDAQVENEHLVIPVSNTLRTRLHHAAYFSLFASGTAAGMTGTELFHAAGRDVDRLVTDDNTLICDPAPIYALGNIRTVDASFAARAYLSRIGSFLKFYIGQTSLTMYDDQNADRVIAVVPLKQPFSVDRVAKLNQEVELGADDYALSINNTSISYANGYIRISGNLDLDEN